MPAKEDVPFEPHQINHWAWNDEAEPAQAPHGDPPNPAFSLTAVRPAGARSPVVRAFSDLRHGPAR